MNSEDVSVDLLIDEIEKRDAIWNLSSKDYSNKIIKRRSWEELVLIFCNNSDSEEKKKNLGSILQKKLKNLRDAYVKERRQKKTKNLKSGSSATTTASFTYFQRLSFLKQVVQKKATDNSLDVEEISANVDLNNINSSVKFPTENVPRKKYKLHPADEHFANILEKSINTRQNNAPEKKEEDDEDKLFCLSLVKEIKKVSENRRLKLKIEIYNLLERYQSAQAHSFEDLNYPSTSYNSQRHPRNNPTSSKNPQYSDTMRYSERESSTQYGYTTTSYTSPPTSQITSPGSYEESQELDLFSETID